MSLDNIFHVVPQWKKIEVNSFPIISGKFVIQCQPLSVYFALNMKKSLEFKRRSQTN